MTKTKKKKYRFTEPFLAVPPLLIEKYGRSTAIVWSVIFGLSQLRNGVCNASKDTIADKAGLTKKPLRAKIDILVADGWIEDLTPERTHRPHHYIAGEAALKSFLEVVSPVVSPNAPEQGDGQSEGERKSPPDAPEKGNGQSEGERKSPPDAPEKGNGQSEGERKSPPDAPGKGNGQSEGERKSPPDAPGKGNGQSEGERKSPPDAPGKGNGQSEGERKSPPDAPEPLRGGEKVPPRGGEIPSEGGRKSPQIESLKESLKDSINKDSSSSSRKNKKTSSQVISNDDEDDEDGILQTNQENLLALFVAAGISATNRQKLQKENLHLDDVLSTLAWCHNKSASGVRKPGIIAPRNLLNGDYPAATCYKPTYWGRHIPDAILERAGLMEYVKKRIGDNGYTKDDLEDDFASEDKPPAWVYDGPNDARQWWVTAKSQLQLEMPKAAFDTWIRDAELAAFEDDVFTILVQNAYAVDWLESRLTSTITRLLTGSMGRPVEVEFITEDAYLERLDNDG